MPNESTDGACAAAFAASRSGRVLVEQYLAGDEFSIETFAIAGQTYILAVTRKEKMPGTQGTVSIEIATPELPDALMQRIGNVAVRALEILGYTDGPGHTEVMLDSDGNPFPIDAAGRGGGFMVAEGIAPAVSGYALAEATVLTAVGRAPPLPGPLRRAATLRFFPARAGVVRAIRGFDALNLHKEVRGESFVSVGECIGLRHTKADRLGYLLASADTAALARRRADLAQELIEFDIKTKH